MKPNSIRNLILRVLKIAEPYALPVEQLLAECNLQARPPITEEQLLEHLNWLKAIQYVDFLPDAMDPENGATAKWLIREPGLALLRR